MMQDCASSNKIKENKYKILRMSLLLGSDDDREETINNFEDAAREIDAMNDEIYLKDLEDKFYDTLKLEEEEKKLAVLVDYIGGRVEQRISLLSDFANVTGFDLTNLPPIKYYDKLDDYKERLKYIREYLSNTEQINQLTTEIEQAENQLKEAYINKATSEECNSRNEEILLNKFKNIIRPIKEFADINEENIDKKLNEIIAKTEESKKSLDIFTKSFTTLSGSGISYEEEQEYASYVENAKEVYYANKEQEFLLKIYKSLYSKEQEYNQVLLKRETINNILYERMELRKELQIEEIDILSSLYDLLERQYEDIQRQKDNMENIETLTETIETKKQQVNDLEQDNQKVEILALLREFCIIDTYSDITPSNENGEQQEEIEPPKEEIAFTEEFPPIITEETKEDATLDTVSTTTNDTPTTSDIVDNNITNEKEEKSVKENQVIAVEKATNIDLDLVHAKADKVMKRVGEMLGIKTEDTKIVSVTEEPEEPKTEPPKPEKVVTNDLSSTSSPLENPLFNSNISTLEKQEETNTTSPFMNGEENNFWFPSDTPDALNELPDLETANDNNFFANNNIAELNFPDLNINFGNNDMEENNGN